jgi:hypothetical protein
VAEPSPTPGNAFTRGILVIGLVLITLAGVLLAYALGKNRDSPDPGTLVYAGEQGVFVHDLSTGEDQRILRLPAKTIVAEVSPDGRFIAYAQDQGQLWMFDREKRDRYQIAERFVVPVGWTPDSKLVAREITGDGDLVTIDPSGERKVLLNVTSNTIGTPIWISETRFAIGDPRAPDDAKLVSTTAAESPIVTSDFGVPLAASPDGAELLFQKDHKVSVGKIGPDGVSDRRVIFRGDANVAATSKQGFVAIAGKDAKGTKGVWVLQGGTQTKLLARGAVPWLVWTRDGSTVVYERDGALYAITIGRKTSKRVSRRGVDVFPLLSFNVVPTGG